MLVHREGRIFSVLGVSYFLAARFCYCYIFFYPRWAEPLLIVLLSKIMGGDCEAMILAAAQAMFWPTRVFGVYSGCLFVLTRFTCGNRGKLYMSWFQLARAPEGRCLQACLYNRVLPAVLISKMTETFI